MKCAIKKDNIIDMLSSVQGITGKKSSLAITENLLITAIENKITVCATDIEVGFEGIYEAEIEKEGKIAINARYLYDIIKKTRKEIIYLNEKKKQWIEITDLKDKSSLEFNIMGADPDEFPELPQIEDVSYFNIPAAQLKKMILWAIMVMFSSDEKRTHVLGVNFTYLEEQQKIRMISTDGRRLTKTEFSYKNPTNSINQVETIIIPKKGLSEAYKFIRGEGNIGIGFKNNYCVIKKENEIIYINLLSGNFPNLNSLFEEDDKYRIEMKKNELKEMLERMSILTNDDYKGVIFRFEDNYLYINAANPDRGESYEFMMIDFKGEKIETMFNPHYFIDALNLIEKEKIVIKLLNGKSPCIISGMGDEENINIIMPMKI